MRTVTYLSRFWKTRFSPLSFSGGRRHGQPSRTSPQVGRPETPSGAWRRVGFTSFNGGNGGNYQLSSSSQFKSAAPLGLVGILGRGHIRD